MIADGSLPAGYATEDGTGLHYVGTRLHEVLGTVPGKRAWHIEPAGTDSGYAEQAIEARHWVPPAS